MLERWFGRAAPAANENAAVHALGAVDWQRAVPAGMIQFGSLTYRILRLSDNEYGIVRLVDDKFIGRFEQRPLLTVIPGPTESAELIESLARRAIRNGRTAWVPRAAG